MRSTFIYLHFKLPVLLTPIYTFKTRIPGAIYFFTHRYPFSGIKKGHPGVIRGKMKNHWDKKRGNGVKMGKQGCKFHPFFNQG